MGITKEEALKIISTHPFLFCSFPDDVIEALDMAIKALEQEPRKDEVILTNKEYRELISNEYDHGYCKGYAEALQEPVLDKIRAEIEAEKLEDSPNFCVKAHNNAVDRVLGIIDKYKTESENA